MSELSVLIDELVISVLLAYNSKMHRWFVIGLRKRLLSEVDRRKQAAKAAKGK